MGENGTMLFLEQLKGICMWVVAIGSAGGLFWKLFQPWKKIREDVNAIQQSHIARCREVDGAVEDIAKDLSFIRSQQEIMMRTMLNLIETSITGNNIDGLKQSKEDLQNFLITNTSTNSTIPTRRTR